MKVLVTTANFGGPTLRNYKEQDTAHEVSYISYNDDNFPRRDKAMHPRLKGKIPKMLAWELHPGYDYYIWLDSTFSIPRVDTIDWFVKQCKGANICLFKHSERNSIKQELAFMEKRMNEGYRFLREKYSGEPIREQVQSYVYDDDILFECGAYIYSKKLVTDKNYNIMKEWFYHNCIWSVQDQLSLPYLVKKFNVKFKIFDTDIYNSPYVKYNYAQNPNIMKEVLQAATDLTSIVPENEVIILVNDSTFSNEHIPNRQVFPFLEKDGEYIGAPLNSESAINELERMKQFGANYIAIAWPSFWWLDYYTQFNNYVRSNFPCVLENERLIVFDLTYS